MCCNVTAVLQQQLLVVAASCMQVAVNEWKPSSKKYKLKNLSKQCSLILTLCYRTVSKLTANE